MARYIDTNAMVNVIGGIFIQPSLLDIEDKYTFSEYDFPTDYHRIIFGSISNLHELGVGSIEIETIEDYLSEKPKQLAIYQANNGREHLTKLKDNVSVSTFGFYYQRMKKMSLLRRIDEELKMDLSWLYDINNIVDLKKKEVQDDWLNNTPIEEIMKSIDDRIETIRSAMINDGNIEIEDAGSGILNLIQSLIDNPDVGYPLYSEIANSITRGARLGKFYLRSAATGVGKTRAMVADAATVSCSKMFDNKTNQWIELPLAQPSLMIVTEQELAEIQTQLLAFISGVEEEHIMMGEYQVGELDRVLEAGRHIQESPLHILSLPDFSLEDIENAIKKGIREHDVKYIFFDYIHTSMKIMSEVTSKTKISGLQEHNVLFMMSIRIKDICVKHGVFIMSSTQLNTDYRTARIYDQNLLRGAKAIADKIDVGMIMLEADEEDREPLAKICAATGYEMPDIKISVYKNRGGRHKDVLMWCTSERGLCRIEPIFVTDYDYNLVSIEKLKIDVKE